MSICQKVQPKTKKKQGSLGFFWLLIYQAKRLLLSPACLCPFWTERFSDYLITCVKLAKQFL